MAKLMPITGGVLEWALRDRNLSLSVAAERLGVSRSELQDWIDEDSKPNKGQFSALVKLLGCTPSFLFLPEPPAQSRAIAAEFRRHPGSPKEIPSETASALQTASTVLTVADWLAVRSTQPKSDRVPHANRKEPPDAVAGRLRDWLEWSIQEQTGSGTTDSSAAKAMRAALHRRGVVVLHLTMDEDVTRGFSLHRDGVSVMAINTRDHVRARLFSYAHELAHLALRDDSVCLTRSDAGTEGFCNRVAAALLMPASVYRQFVKERTGGRLETRENVVSVRNYFKVSLQAAAIRGETLGVASENLFELIEFEAEAKGRGGTYVPGNERTRPRVRVDQYGSAFVNSLIDAEQTGHLRRTQVLDLLRLSDTELDAARSLAMSGAVG